MAADWLSEEVVFTQVLVSDSAFWLFATRIVNPTIYHDNETLLSDLSRQPADDDNFP